MIKVVHINKEEYDIYIGRGSKWGNPFVLGKDGDRTEVTCWVRCTVGQLLDEVFKDNDIARKCYMTRINPTYAPCYWPQNKL